MSLSSNSSSKSTSSHTTIAGTTVANQSKAERKALVDAAIKAKAAAKAAKRAAAKAVVEIPSVVLEEGTPPATLEPTPSFHLVTGGPSPEVLASLSKGKESVADSAKLTLVRTDNPKRPNTASYRRYECYAGCSTVGEAKAKGVTAGDIRWDSARGFITVG